MSAPVPTHDLLVGPADASGARTPDVDLVLCADIARTLAQSARAWAGESPWTGLGGFDASGGFWLAPHPSDHLAFLRAPYCLGWLHPSPCPPPTRPQVTSQSIIDNTSGPRFAASLAARFPSADSVPELCAPLSFLHLHPVVRALTGFGGCALRHPVTGLWKPVLAAPDSARLAVSTRALTPLLRVLSSQGLPLGRLLLTSQKSAALVWRTPGKVYGCLHLDQLASLPRAAAAVDSLLLCTSRADTD